MQLTLKEIWARLKVCKEKCKYFHRHRKRYRRKHLHRRIKIAQRKRDETTENRILAILQREKDRSYWRRLSYSMAKPRGGSVRIVQTKSDDGHVTEHSTQDGVKQAIWNEIHGNRFFLAKQATICQGRSCSEFGYLAKSISAKKVLDEADCNCSNKMIFGDRMMHNVRTHGLMREEIYSERGKMADDSSLAKVLFYDIV